MKMSFQNASFLEICQLFGKSRQGWYSIAQRQVNARLQEELVINWILEIRQVLPMVGGLKLYKMIKPDLLAHSFVHSDDRRGRFHSRSVDGYG